MTTPMSILRESVKAVPAVKYALGVAGIASVIAIVRSLNVDYRVAVIGTVIMLLFMTVLVIFAKLSSLAPPDFHLPALVFTWFSLLLLIAVAFSMFSSVFFGWPLNLQVWIMPSVIHDARSEAQQVEKDEPARGQAIPVFRSGTKMEDQLSTSADPDKTNKSNGMKGPDTGSVASPVLNDDCPEIAVADYSKNPPEFHKERRCIQ